MGKTPKPKTLCITDPALLETKEIQALKAKGHTIMALEGTLQPDLILGPNCRMVTPETVKYAALALKELGKVKPVLSNVTLEPLPTTTEEDDDAEA